MVSTYIHKQKHKFVLSLIVLFTTIYHNPSITSEFLSKVPVPVIVKVNVPVKVKVPVTVTVKVTVIVKVNVIVPVIVKVKDKDKIIGKAKKLSYLCGSIIIYNKE